MRWSNGVMLEYCNKEIFNDMSTPSVLTSDKVTFRSKNASRHMSTSRVPVEMSRAVRMTSCDVLWTKIFERVRQHTRQLLLLHIRLFKCQQRLRRQKQQQQQHQSVVVRAQQKSGSLLSNQSNKVSEPNPGNKSRVGSKESSLCYERKSEKRRVMSTACDKNFEISDILNGDFRRDADDIDDPPKMLRAFVNVLTYLKDEVESPDPTHASKAQRMCSTESFATSDLLLVACGNENGTDKNSTTSRPVIAGVSPFCHGYKMTSNVVAIVVATTNADLKAICLEDLNCSRAEHVLVKPGETNSLACLRRQVSETHSTGESPAVASLHRPSAFIPDFSRQLLQRRQCANGYRLLFVIIAAIFQIITDCDWGLFGFDRLGVAANHHHSGSSSSGGLPCVYEGHLRTEKNWYGYLASISVVTTGRLTFEFTYSADKCCQNILFYSEDQISIISARMNCWQKDNLLRPEEDQVLRLTPRFSWSGCHMTHPNGISTYVCEGGRSFTVDQPASRPMSWYVAVSNCATHAGLDLQYRIVVYGHIGDCRTRSALPGGNPAGDAIIGSSMIDPNAPSRAMIVYGEGGLAAIAPAGTTCVVEGDLNVTTSWYGFIANVTVARAGGFRFRFTFPLLMQTQNVILYTEEDLTKMTAREQTCWQKEGVIKSRNVADQILSLNVRSSWNGCLSKNTTSSSGSVIRELECVGERRYDEARRMFVAVDNCQSPIGVVLSYRFDFYGYETGPDGGSCSSPPSARPRTRSLVLVIGCVVVLLNIIFDEVGR